MQQEEWRSLSVSAETVFTHPHRHTGADLRAVQTAALRVISTCCDSLSQLDEALLSTLPPSYMAQSEPLHTEDDAASTSVDHQDTAAPLSTRPPHSV